MRFTRILIMLVVAVALAACGSDNNNNVANPPAPGTSTFLASGGTSTSGTGGNGGYLNVQTYGAVKVLRSGTVDASFGASASTPTSIPTSSFGTDHYIVSGGTMTVLLDTDESGVLCTFYGDAHLYIGNGDGFCDGNDTMVTGLTIDAGATLVFVDQGYWGGYGTLWLSNDLVVNGTITSTAPSVYIEANMIDVESGGMITTSATSDGLNGGGIYLGNGNGITKTIINRGTIEAKGLGSGNGGHLYFDADDLIDNSGTIDASGGSNASGSGGNANEIDIYLTSGNTGTFHNSGALLAKGGDSTDSTSGSGGTGGYIYIDVNDLVVSTNTSTIDASGGSSATGSGGSANEIDIYLNNDGGTFYSFGTMLAKGGNSGSGTGGIGGYLYIDVPDLVVNTGTIDLSGGNSDTGSGGDGGEIDVYVGYGDFHSSGTVRMNGGNGGTNGGSAEWGDYWYGYSAWIETVYSDNTKGKGDIIISGTWEANGGNGANGPGGDSGYLYFQTDALGAVTFNANMSSKGGDSSEAGYSGGSAAYGIEIYSYNYHGDPVTPGKISIAGKYDLRGGNGDESGGNGGYLYIYSNGYNLSNKGTDVELVGFPTLIMNGGDGANGGSASSSAIHLYISSPGGLPGGTITNEANVEARGGNGAETLGSAGGSGGNVEMITSAIGGPSEVITNSGNIDISGGTGDAPGNSGSMINLWAQHHLTNSGNLTANGGNMTSGGTNVGGSGGYIYLNSNDFFNSVSGAAPTTNTGTLSVTGGAPGGSPGSASIDTGGPT